MKDEEIVRTVLKGLSEVQQKLDDLRQLIEQIDTDRHAMVYCEELD
jgi:hypothetical protein